MDAGALALIIFLGLPFFSLFIYTLTNLIKRPMEEKRHLIEKQENNEIEKYKTLCRQQEVLNREAEEKLKKAEEMECYYLQSIKELSSYIEDKCQCYPHLALVMADVLTAHYERSAQWLEDKKPPAWAEAKRIRDLQQETRIILAQKKELEYILKYIRYCFPFIHQKLRADFGKTSNSSYGLLDPATRKQFELDLKQIDQQVEIITSFEQKTQTLAKKINAAFGRQYPVSSFFDSIVSGRLDRALESNIEYSDLQISATIQSTRNRYQTSLSHCTCEDYQHRRVPCKHMLFLAYSFGLLYEGSKERHDKLLKNTANLAVEEAHLQNNIKKEKEQHQKLTKYSTELEALTRKKYEEYKAALENLTKRKCAEYPHLAAAMADLETLYYIRSAEDLENKKQPALVEAKRIRDLQRDTKLKLAHTKELEYKLAYICELFPNIDDIFDEGFDNVEDFELETEDNTDRARHFLSHEEYISLSVTERNQLALDRYLTRPKTKWQIGRDYELYVGLLYEQKGYRVQFTGIIEKLEDMGRDLIASKADKTLIIQCKNWSHEKSIHEKHIFQLYGTVVLYRIEHPDQFVEGVFVTTTKLSEKAKQIADYLNIAIKENLPLGEYPRIKCNINRTTGEKIYHLPFDQQYDRAVIDPSHDEMYAFTVSEAEEHGFRRALKHFNS